MPLSNFYGELAAIARAVCFEIIEYNIQ